MNFILELLYLSLFFPLWIIAFIFGYSIFSLNTSKKLPAILTTISAFLPCLLGILSLSKNITYENTFNFISINEINLQFGTLINQNNMLMLIISSILLTFISIFTYKKYKEKDYTNKFYTGINFITFCTIAFFTSPNLIQMFIFSSIIPIILYCLENMTNTSHERAKNFLVINKLADFTLLIVISSLFFFDTFYNLQPISDLLSLNTLQQLFESIYSISEIQVFSLICILLFIAILIKSILVFIHPLKETNTKLLLFNNSLIFGIYWLMIFLPIMNIFEYLNLYFIIIGIITLISTLFTIYLKIHKHTFIVNINQKSALSAKKIFLSVANIICQFDEKILDKTYELFSNIFLKISDIFKISNEKKAIYSLLFNIAGILLLILIIWIIYHYTIKG